MSLADLIAIRIQSKNTIINGDDINFLKEREKYSIVRYKKIKALQFKLSALRGDIFSFNRNFFFHEKTVQKNIEMKNYLNAENKKTVANIKFKQKLKQFQVKQEF